jgi:hypothetical protein
LQITVMSKGIFYWRICRSINRGPRSSHSVALDGRC